MSKNTYFPSLVDVEDLESVLQEYRELLEDIELHSLNLSDEEQARLEDIDYRIYTLTDDIEATCSDIATGGCDSITTEELENSLGDILNTLAEQEGYFDQE